MQNKTVMFHERSYDRFIEIKSNSKRKKLHRMNQTLNFLGGSFSGRDNVRAPIQFKTKNNPNLLKGDFSSKPDIHFHINSTRVITPVKLNKLEFFQH